MEGGTSVYLAGTQTRATPGNSFVYSLDRLGERHCQQHHVEQQSFSIRLTITEVRITHKQASVFLFAIYEPGTSNVKTVNLAAIRDPRYRPGSLLHATSGPQQELTFFSSLRPFFLSFPVISSRHLQLVINKKRIIREFTV